MNEKEALKIQPKLQAISIDHEWTDVQDSRRWAKIVAIYLEDELSRIGFLKKKRREIGEIFYLLVCSDKFIKNPDRDWRGEEFIKALVQDVFTFDKVSEYVDSVVSQIGKVTISEFDHAMRKAFDMSDWDQTRKI